ncbi:uncharacterized protein F4807DRAFT_466223 [Annulohypoxylon truncatum]|uniref:uncharacterized protein n=1 Tax=Annulohypoxylon truncatum TaxID=327061 RepID=UPI002007398E|nr:uncharacterized protein F4807DRAFT_466223 [Annulohypoxylon truncatum]KAI1214732.1 hypothetical protein F4807DRAFT_466223 [Annulohypoxylon truncatum]
MQKFTIPLLCQFFVSLTQGLVVHEKRVDSSYTWKIKDLNRLVRWDENLVDLSMTIVDGSPTGVYCEVIARAPPDTDLNAWSFSNFNCLNNDWSIYWGYQYGNDAGVMTVVSPDKDKRAFFGFDHVNTQTHLGNSGPSQVSAV